MVKAKFYKKNNSYLGVELKGHADYDVEGKDIVCAAISSVVIGGLNAISEINKFDVKIEKGYVLARSKETLNEHDRVVIETIKIQLETIKESNPKYLMIEEERIA